MQDDFMNEKQKGEKEREESQCEVDAFVYESSHRWVQTNIFFSESYNETFKLIFYPFLDEEDDDRTLIFILMLALSLLDVC